MISDIGDWMISLKSNVEGEHVVRGGSFAFEGINKSPIRRFKNVNGLPSYEYEAGNLTGILVRRKFVGKMDFIIFYRLHYLFGKTAFGI